MIDKTKVETLIDKAATADKSEDAMRFSQAALNAENALIGMSNAKDSK
jgi:hypothetical protein